MNSHEEGAAVGSGHEMPLAYGQHRERIDHLANNVAALLTALFEAAQEMATRSEECRRNVFVDLRALLNEIPAPDQGIILTRLEYQVSQILEAESSQKAGQDSQIVAARSSPTISFSSGCVGRSGGGINATDGAVTVGACAVVRGGSVIGGGVQGSFSY